MNWSLYSKSIAALIVSVIVVVLAHYGWKLDATTQEELAGLLVVLVGSVYQVTNK